MNKIRMTFWVSLDIASYLRSRDNQAKTIDSALRSSYGFKSFNQAKEAEDASVKKAKGRGRKDRRVRRGDSGLASD